MPKIEVDEIEDVVVIELGADFPDTRESEFLDIIKTKLGSGRRKFLVNCGRLQRITSTGIGMLVAASMRIKKASGHMKLCGLSERIKRSFISTSHLPPLDVFDEDCDDALADLIAME